MNHLTFNDALPKPWRDPLITEAPLFLYDFQILPEHLTDAMRDPKDEWMFFKYRLPFPYIRVGVTIDPTTVGEKIGREVPNLVKTSVKWWISQTDEEVNLLVCDCMKTAQWLMINFNKNKPDCFSRCFTEDLREILPSDVGEAGRKAMQGMLSFHLLMLETFMTEIYAPMNVVAKVSPDKQGKSVVWTKAREHYVILNRSHPANRKEVAPEATVRVSDKDVKRCAHTRRAHLRILRSPRFKNKRGQVINVRSSWVGPEKWRSAGSIYQLHRDTIDLGVVIKLPPRS